MRRRRRKSNKRSSSRDELNVAVVGDEKKEEEEAQTSVGKQYTLQGGGKACMTRRPTRKGRQAMEVLVVCSGEGIRVVLGR